MPEALRGDVFCGEVGEHQALIMPPGYIVTELSGTLQVVGMRAGLWTLAHTDMLQDTMDKCKAHTLSLPPKRWARWNRQYRLFSNTHQH